MKKLIILITLLLPACASQFHTESVYQSMGGYQKVEDVVNNSIVEIEKYPVIFEYFKESDVERFRAKLTEHICYLLPYGWSM